jgi:hypothetical protein
LCVAARCFELAKPKLTTARRSFASRRVHQKIHDMSTRPINFDFRGQDRRSCCIPRHVAALFSGGAAGLRDPARRPSTVQVRTDIVYMDEWIAKGVLPMHGPWGSTSVRRQMSSS